LPKGLSDIIELFGMFPDLERNLILRCLDKRLFKFLPGNEQDKSLVINNIKNMYQDLRYEKEKGLGLSYSDFKKVLDRYFPLKRNVV